MNMVGTTDNLLVRASGSLVYNSIQVELVLETISHLSGILSVLVWLFAQIPQVIENHLNRSVSGISLSFLMCWIAGDTTNLIGCILTKALPFQTCISAYYCFIDLILSIQYWYYTKIYPKQKVHHNLFTSPTVTSITPVTSRHSHNHKTHGKRNKFEADITRPPIEITNSHYSMNQGKSSFIRRLLSSSIVGSLTKPANAYSISKIPPKENFKSIWTSVLQNVVLIWGSILHRLTQIHLDSHQFGIYFAWVCSFLYLSSRTPQILKNYRDKSTGGISLYLFLFAMIGNTFYTISVTSNLYLVYLCDLSSNSSEFVKLFWSQLPFIVGSCGTILFDLFILFQFKYYKVQPSRNSIGSKGSSGSTRRNHLNHRHSLGDIQDSPPMHFQKPDWYTNNNLFSDTYHNQLPEVDFNNRNICNQTIDSITDNSPLIRRYGQPQLSYDAIPPPPHYVSGYSNNATYTPSNGIISTTLNALGGSFPRTSSIFNVKPSNSMNSANSVHSNSINTPLTTSVLPSLISSYYSVSKRKSDQPKIPFSPIDFLNDNLCQENSSFGSIHGYDQNNIEATSKKF